MRVLGLLLLIGATGCSGGAGGCALTIGGPAPAATEVGAVPTMPHGDHAPHHGGVVMMKGDLHYEVVLDPTGRYRLYFTDATRADLPATTAARASITVMRPNEPPEGVSLQIDEAGESWIGNGKPVGDPAKTTARISYTLRSEEPYWIDLPFTPEAADPNAPDPHKTAKD